MVKHKDIMEAIEKLKGIKGAYLHTLGKYAVSSSINKKGIFRTTLELDGKQMFKDIKEGLNSDLKLKPYLLFIDDKTNEGE